MSDEFAKELEASLEQADNSEAMEWNRLEQMKEEGTVLKLTIGGVVKGGVIVYVEGVRGFIPASLLSTKYVEDLNAWLDKEVEAKIITVEQADNKLVLSAKAVERAKENEAKKEKIASLQVGAVLEGTVENTVEYGAFVDLGDGISGLVHISQMSNKRVKSADDVVKAGEKVQVKIIKINDGKVSLSMKALLEDSEAEERGQERGVEYKEDEAAKTSLGDLLSNIKL